jgi:hypothetical protein
MVSHNSQVARERFSVALHADRCIGAPWGWTPLSATRLCHGDRRYGGGNEKAAPEGRFFGLSSYSCARDGESTPELLQ